MKIFLSFLQAKENYAVPAYDFWRYYLEQGIAEAGHSVVTSPDADWARGLVLKGAELEAWRETTWDSVIALFRVSPPDLFLSYLYPGQIDVSAILEIRKMGIPCVNFFCDNVREFRSVPEQFRFFDLNWVPESGAIDMYRAAGLPYIHLPMPMWVSPALRSVRPARFQQVTFIGSHDIQRQLLFEKIVKIDPDIGLYIYGRGWMANDVKAVKENTTHSMMARWADHTVFLKRNGLAASVRRIVCRQKPPGISGALAARVKPAPGFGAYNELTACSTVTVGINRYPSYRFPFHRPGSYSRLRDIEAPMLGACYLTEYTKGIDELYQPGKEIECYRNEYEFVEKVRMLFGDPQHRKSLQIAGQRRALTDLSIPASLQKINFRLTGHGQSS